MNYDNDETVGEDHGHTLSTYSSVEGVYHEEIFQREEATDIDDMDLLLELVVEEEEKEDELLSRDIVADAEFVVMMSPPSGCEMESSSDQKATITGLVTFTALFFLPCTCVVMLWVFSYGRIARVI